MPGCPLKITKYSNDMLQVCSAREPELCYSMVRLVQIYVPEIPAEYVNDVLTFYKRFQGLSDEFMEVVGKKCDIDFSDDVTVFWEYMLQLQTVSRHK